tara:strand:+ start:184 stop:621 length:438 start_codon:yes stop_codon:yes gene_type:complete
MKLLEAKQRTWTINNNHYNAEVIDLKDLVTIDDNTPQDDKDAMMALLEKTIPEKGMLHPIIITMADFSIWRKHQHKIPKDAKYVVWYGNNRYRYAKKHEYTHIHCLLNVDGVRDQLCEQMNIRTRVNNITENIWLEEGKKLLNFC